jgi:hypothetical protein
LARPSGRAILVADRLERRVTKFEGVMIEPYQVLGYRLSSASVTANARDVPAPLWFLAPADCE